MAILDLVTVPNPILNQSCSKITAFDDDLKHFITDMFDTMHHYKGIGLAAPQVGILEQLCICEFEDDTLVLINPTITAMRGKQQSEEGCLSIPNQLFDVDRATSVDVLFQDHNGKENTLAINGMLAIIVQHEIDHLNGVLINKKGKFIKEV